MSKQDLEHIDDVHKRWIHRRRMAYIAIFSNIIIVAFAFAFPIRAKEILGLLSSFVMTMFGIVGAYTGLSTLDDVMMRTKNDSK